MRVHITGLKEAEKAELGARAAGLGLVVEDQFLKSLDALVCDSVVGQKYRMAKLFRIRVVRPQWLLDSARQNRLLSPGPYELGAFENLRLLFFGFDVFRAETFSDAARKQGAVVVRDLARVLAQEDRVNVVVCRPTAALERLHPLRASAILVFEGWFLECLRADRFLYPDAFHLPFCSVSLRVPIKLETRKVDVLLDTVDLASPDYRLFPDCLFYFLSLDAAAADNPQLWAEEESLASRLVALMGGLVARRPLRSTTHVLTDFIDEPARERLAKSAENAVVVSFAYLKDCLVCRQRLAEVEYPPRSVDSRPAVPGGPRADSRASLGPAFSRGLRPDGDHFGQKFESFLFRHVVFSVHPAVPDFNRLLQALLVHSGSVLPDVRKFVFAGSRLHFILPDGFPDSELKALRDRHGDAAIAFLSPRWVDHCLVTRQVVRDVEAARLVHLLPFPHSTPYPDFAGLRVCLKGFEPADKLVLAEVVRVLGGTPERLDPDNPAQVRVFRDVAAGTAAGLANVRSHAWLLGCVRAGQLLAAD